MTIWGLQHRHGTTSDGWLYSTEEKAHHGSCALILEYLDQVKRLAPDIADAIEAMILRKMCAEAVKAWNSFHAAHGITDEIEVSSQQVDSGPALP